MPNPIITNQDTSSLVVFNGQYSDITLNAGGAVIYPKGTVLAFDAAAAKWKITESGTPAVANAKALLSQTTEFPGAGDKLVRAVIGGEVDADLLVFDGSDDLDTIPGGADDSFRVQLRGYGIIAKPLAEQYKQDNQ